jgi:ferric-dicitrate binding protein FerR (iron transport regulator)
MKPNLENPWLGELSDEKTAQLWARVAKRLPPPKQAEGLSHYFGPRVWALSFAVVVGLVALGYISSSKPNGLAALSTTAEPLTLTLDEGTRLRLSPHSEVNVTSSGARKVSLELGRGSIECDVVPNVARRFSVFSGDFEVRVVGTKFHVERQVHEQGARVEVRVERGAVEVRRTGQEERVYVVRAGQKWSSEERLVAPSPQAATPSPVVTLPRPEVEPTTLDLAPLEPKAVPGEGQARGPEVHTSKAQTKAADVFEQARSARQSGRPAPRSPTL